MHVLHIFVYVISTTGYNLGRYEPSSPSTKELLGSVVALLAVNLTNACSGPDFFAQN